MLMKGWEGAEGGSWASVGWLTELHVALEFHDRVLVEDLAWRFEVHEVGHARAASLLDTDAE